MTFRNDKHQSNPLLMNVNELGHTATMLLEVLACI